MINLLIYYDSILIPNIPVSNILLYTAVAPHNDFFVLLTVDINCFWICIKRLPSNEIAMHIDRTIQSGW
jgi:hypothetical protein